MPRHNYNNIIIIIVTNVIILEFFIDMVVDINIEPLNITWKWLINQLFKDLTEQRMYFF